MKQLFLFLLFLFIFVEAVGTVKYHGKLRFWTYDGTNGQTYIALPVLKDSVADPVELFFPIDKSFAQLSSDIKLVSTSDGKCQDRSNTLKFKLDFVNNGNYIRGDIKVVFISGKYTVRAYLYEKCELGENPDAYALPIHRSLNLQKRPVIDKNPLCFYYEARTCFKTGNPFHASDGKRNVMKLSVSASFDCQAFMILPSYVELKDDSLPAYKATPLNDSFAGHDAGFWWKNKADPLLPDQLSFMPYNDVRIDILKSTKEVPYFFRVGEKQPLPSLKFRFGDNCLGAIFDLFVNLKQDCSIRIKLEEGGFILSAKALDNSVKFSWSPTLIFGERHVYVKFDAPIALKSIKTCDYTNVADVPLDQFVLQIAPLSTSLGQCNKAEITLLSEDVAHGIDVLIDRRKLIDNGGNGTTQTIGSTTFIAASATTPVSETGSLPWWGYILCVGGFVVLMGIAFFSLYKYCLRPRLLKHKQSKIPKAPVESIQDEDDDGRRRTTEVQTAVSQHSVVKKEKTKEDVKPKNEKKKGKAQPQLAPSKNEKPSGAAEPKKEKPPKAKADEPPPKAVQPPPEATTVPKPTPKADLKPAPPPKEVSAQTAVSTPAPKFPPHNLKYRCMYLDDGFSKMDERFDFHAGESDEFKPTKVPPVFVPPADYSQKFDNFWDCLEKLGDIGRYCRVYDDENNLSSDVYFWVRDLVSRDYGELRNSLANRMLEVVGDDKEIAKKTPRYRPEFNEEGKKIRVPMVRTGWVYSLRVFYISYDPLTIEIHCRGPWPYFIFEVLECRQCSELFGTLHENDWKRSPVTCGECWRTFVCRVKRTPINSHQFLSYYGNFGDEEPADPNEINNILVIRGNCESTKIRECSEGCIFEDKSHPTSFEIYGPSRQSPTEKSKE